MRLKNLLPRLLLGAPLALGACGAPTDNTGGAAVKPTPAATAAPPATPTPQAQVVTATVEEAQLAAGGAGEATVRIDIAQGYHVQANPASDKFYVATELRAEPQEGLTPGKPVYPPGRSLKLGFSDKPLSVYEGSVRIKLPLRADAGASKGRRTLRAKVRVQPCNDEACLQPREIDAPIPVTVN
ncbi:MAG: protein-disulfide reductase DsbD N-terminal domain-containing protein [Acidobacteria bacterium]|nr:protein-disulfide reductase DsbD N-terminal domain-containing protein [Acidobacteriota bacterium]